MDRKQAQRATLALVGGLAGASLYALFEVLGARLLNDRLALMLLAGAGSFFAGLLAMAGPIPMIRAARGALAVALAVALLLGLASLRFATVAAFLDTRIAVLAGLVLALLPLPFVVAADGPGWRDYPALFQESWSMVVRTGAACLFTALVWTVILLSDALLGLVGIDAIGRLLQIDVVPWLVTGAVLGLALAVVSELSAVVTPYLVLRLLRLLLPAVLVVLAVFLLALPVQGLDRLFGGLSAATTMLGMTALAATLVTTAVERNDAEAVQGPLMLRATQGLALILPGPALLAAWAMWLRVAQYGLTPDRIFGVLVAVLGLGYGLLYAVAVLRGGGWTGRIRAANVTMALASITAAALWLTPLLNPEALSARNMVQRYEAGQTPATALDLAALDSWGTAGAAARARLQELALSPDQAALANRLAQAPALSPATGTDADPAATRAALVALLPLQPPTATATRDMLLDALAPEDIAAWLDMCRTPLPKGGPGCVMVVADLWPSQPGEEALVALRAPGGWLRLDGMALQDGLLILRPVLAVNGLYPDLAQGEALIAAWQAEPPPLSPVPLNRVGGAGEGLFLQP